MVPICSISIMCLAPPLSQTAVQSQEGHRRAPAGNSMQQEGNRLWELRGGGGCVVREGFLEEVGFNLQGWVECGRVGRRVVQVRGE